MAVTIEIFGVQGYVYDVIKARLKELLDHSGIEYRIQEVQNIEEFIAEGLESVPAIRVNHMRSFTKPEHTSIDEVVAAVHDYILQQGVQVVICPVDFSEHSVNAARWAQQLAKALGMRLKLVHVYLPVSEAQYSVPVDMQGVLESLQQQLAKTAELLTKEQGNGMPILTHLELGDPIQQIVRYSKDPSTGVIVLGTLGESTAIRRLFGSVSSAIGQHANVPVFLIPPGVKYIAPRNIMVAFHQELLSNGALSNLTDMNSRWEAHIQFVHVKQDEEDYPEMRDKLLERMTGTITPAFSFDIREITAESQTLLQALLQFAETSKPDLIVMVTRHRNIIRRLLRPGTTHQLSLHTRWPMLVMHQG